MIKHLDLLGVREYTSTYLLSYIYYNVDLFFLQH